MSQNADYFEIETADHKHAYTRLVEVHVYEDSLPVGIFLCECGLRLPRTLVPADGPDVVTYVANALVPEGIEEDVLPGEGLDVVFTESNRG